MTRHPPIPTVYVCVAYSFIFLSQLLGPEDMVNPHVDELSMMTYLSQFPDCHLKDGAPIKARADPGKVKKKKVGRTDGCLDGARFSVASNRP